MTRFPAVEAADKVADASGAIFLQAALEIALGVQLKDLSCAWAEGLDELDARPDFQLGFPHFVEQTAFRADLR